MKKDTHTLGQKQKSHSFQHMKEINNWLPLYGSEKPSPTKISLNVMGADLHNVMVTHAVSFSEHAVFPKLTEICPVNVAHNV